MSILSAHVGNARLGQSYDTLGDAESKRHTWVSRSILRWCVAVNAKKRLPLRGAFQNASRMRDGNVWLTQSQDALGITLLPDCQRPRESHSILYNRSVRMLAAFGGWF